MSEVLGLEHLALRPEGPTLSLSVGSGQSLALVGASGSGKTWLLRILAGMERPGQGAVRIRGKAAVADGKGISRRMKVQSVARSNASVNAATEVLSALRLWHVRHLPLGDLTPGCGAACELIEPLLSDAEVVLIDGQLDQLDPWALRDVLALMRSRKNTAYVVATNRPDILQDFDALVVMKDQQVRFAGTPSDLLRLGPRHELQVETENKRAVHALVEPFEVSVQHEEAGIRLEAREGQELAARLLLEGYGDVRFVVLRSPSIVEALLSLY